MIKFELGDRVRFSQTLVRQTVGRDRKEWVATGWQVSADEGVVVGRRTLANGDVSYGYYDDPTTFTATERFPAYLVAYHLRRRPVLVLPEHLEAL